ncbi:bifunctional 2',3'-cyclic-nucleotide 2'-phosphodiesterase/3'-nucleotidase [Romboutsia lituseburensis]|uniref:bifunctional 2',3'-cyclic-nucleotide 2'-phosphodiesterase/3'-nucleotidase n=1 Tax=Romboutsia lituseburensis TaxID=1537 RepID=UPI00215A2FD5|nr:bifunctional 2',3'-cyclic-nucleotide 2'-phosphodiesterase/3'-nucleotidase [Romboutsia lituseburensis]MCR8745464.1 bifunctional 2',3'-cyclic-nucleotide 2'-phosphodiesterase/3'-nucleotidase [Romboutsia lituseburensis]
MAYKKHMKRISVFVLILGLTASGIQPLKVLANESTTKSGEPTIDLRVVGTSDLHGSIMDYDYYTLQDSQKYGLVKLSTIMKNVKSEVDKTGDKDNIDNTVIFDNGDTIQGNPFADYYNNFKTVTGEHPIYKAMNEVGYDSATLGNHEFNYKLDFLQKIVNENEKNKKNLDILSSNVYDVKGEKNLFKPYEIITETVVDSTGKQQTVKIGVIGFTPEDILVWDKQNLEGKVSVKSFKESAEKFVPKMKAEGADIIVGLAHFGNDTKDVNNLAKVEGIDALVTGHSHASDSGKIEGTEVPFIQPINNASELGVIDLKLKQENGKWVIDKGNTKTNIRKVYDKNNNIDIKRDENLSKFVESYHKPVVDYVKSPVGKTTKDLQSYFTLVQDDASVELVADAQTQYLKKLLKEDESMKKYNGLPILSAAAPFKTGGRSDSPDPTDFVNIKSGNISISDVSSLYKYPNTYTVLKIKGSEVKEWLERSAAVFNTIDPNKKEEQQLVNLNFRGYMFDTIEGLKYEVDVTKHPKYDTSGKMINKDSERIVNLTYNGKPLDKNQEFLVITNNYRAGAEQFAGKTVYAGQEESRQVVSNYIKEKGTITPNADNNWTIKPVQTKGNVVFRTHENGANYLGTNSAISKVGPAKEEKFANYKYDLSKSQNTSTNGFKDIEKHWAKKNIEEFLTKGYIGGYEDKTFRPDNSITRAEFVKLVNKVFELKTVGTEDFKDVKPSDWFYNEICIATKAGYINGYEDKTFRPNQKITREEAASIVASLINLNNDGKLTFKDSNKISTWAKASVDKLSDNKIMGGYEDNTFRPQGKITRAESVSMLSRINK